MERSTCTLSPVLLGVHDSPSSPSLSPYESKIGGLPDFFPGCSLVSPPVCALCGRSLVLLVQVYCPLEESVYHRTLYVFCCTHAACQEDKRNWLVVRSQLRDVQESSVADTREATIPAVDWCLDADEWESHATGKDEQSAHLSAGVSGLEKQVKKLSLVSTECLSSDSLCTATCMADNKSYSAPYYPAGYIRVVEEPPSIESGKDYHHAKSLLKKYEQENSTVFIKEFDQDTYDGRRKSGATGHSLREGYESSAPSHGDKMFLKFHKRLAKSPQQILRYQRGGDALLMMKDQTLPSLLCCQYCQAQCVYELQLMPTLVYLLQTHLSSAKSVGPNHCCPPTVPEFGTVIVFTCSKSCWTEGSQPRLEFVFIQLDRN